MRIKLLFISFLTVCLHPDFSFTQDQCVSSDIENNSPCSNFERYRSYSGRCNNLKSPEQGAARAVQQRILSPDYDDTAISSPRAKGVLGADLPNPRKVSQNVHTSTDELDSQLTVMVMQWGQFIDHDLTLTPHGPIDQCGDCNSQNVNNSACFPIKIPMKDTFFSESGDPKCFNFTRSLPTNRVIREQTNVLTSYLDASMVYGSSKCELDELREIGANSHYMKVSPNRNSLKKLLPTTGDKTACPNSELGKCFLAGDIRVNEQPGLTSMHLIMVREHNRIADELKQMNVLWGMDKVFEETRRIITAQIQHITYNEYLPRVLGPYGLDNFDLDLLTSGYYSDYDNSCSATSFNEFSTAAFRFGHSMIPSQLTLISKEDAQGNIRKETSPLHKHFFNTDLISHSGKLDDLLRGLTMTPMHPTDRHVTEEIKNHLFEVRDKPKSGMDLPALNIQRGRDHGLPGYNKYRQFCNLPKAAEFTDLSNEMSEETICKLRFVYDHPDDIDLYTGLLSETHLPGALTGPTLACIIGLQFKNIRKCDRYWYETSDPEIKYSEKQLQEIRSSSLAALICRNMDENSKMARSSMDLVNNWTNPRVDCEQSIKSIDLGAWREPDTELCGLCNPSCTVKVNNIDTRLNFFNRSLYYFEEDTNSHTWNEGEAACSTLFNGPSWPGHSGNLASFQTREEFNFLVEKVKDSSSALTSRAIGGKRSDSNPDEWIWTDGTPMNKTLVDELWTERQPDNDGKTENIMELWNDYGNDEYGLNDQNPTNRRSSYICRIPCSSTISEKVKGFCEKGSCNKDENIVVVGNQKKRLEYHQGALYYFHPKDKAYSWDEAENACKSWFKGHLTSVQSQDEFNFIAKRVEELKIPNNILYGAGNTWTGGIKDGAQWKWIDGTSMNDLLLFKLWHQGEPNNYLGDENYIELWNKGGKVLLNDQGNTRKKDSFVCKVSCPSTTLSKSSENELKPECNAANHNILDEASRCVTGSRADSYCDNQSEQIKNYSKLGNWKGSGWYRFTGAAGTRMIDQRDTKPKYGSCGTYKTGYIADSHPTSPGKTIDVKICITSFSNECGYSATARITHCGSYFVYKLPETPARCSTRYCGIKEPTASG